MVNWRTEIRFLISKGTTRILRKLKGAEEEGMKEWPVHETGIVEPSPMVIVEKAEGKQAHSKFIFEDICEDAPESKKIGRASCRERV